MNGFLNVLLIILIAMLVPVALACISYVRYLRTQNMVYKEPVKKKRSRRK